MVKTKDKREHKRKKDTDQWDLLIGFTKNIKHFLPPDGPFIEN